MLDQIVIKLSRYHFLFVPQIPYGRSAWECDELDNCADRHRLEGWTDGRPGKRQTSQVTGKRRVYAAYTWIQPWSCPPRPPDWPVMPTPETSGYDAGPVPTAGWKSWRSGRHCL